MSAVFDKRTESTRDDWNTPSWLLDLVRRVRPIDLDPCGNPTSLVGATREYGRHVDRDGLALPWHVAGGGLVFVNPPYGKALPDWARKYAHESERNAEIVALVPARTETKWFRTMRNASVAVCFLSKRVHFVGGTSGATFPSAVFYTGRHVVDFYTAFHEHGWTVPARWAPGVAS